MRNYFYIGVQMEEPHVWGTITEHDAVIFQDNDFEVFFRPRQRQSRLRGTGDQCPQHDVGLAPAEAVSRWRSCAGDSQRVGDCGG